jgi:hypothetical protein
VKGNWPPPRQLDGFDCVVHFFFDDTSLADQPEAAIGLILKDERELVLVKELVAALDAVLENNDFGLTDEEYIATLEWKIVVEVAKRALPVFREGGGEHLDTAPARSAED